MVDEYYGRGYPRPIYFSYKEGIMLLVKEKKRKADIIFTLVTGLVVRHAYGDYRSRQDSKKKSLPPLLSASRVSYSKSIIRSCFNSASFTRETRISG
jgi:hypothetical protein